MLNDPIDLLSTSQLALRTHGLSIAIGARQLLTHLTWQAKAGECWCIIGRNGTGKTTLLRGLAGLMHVGNNTGKIYIHGHELTAWPLASLAKVRAYLPQHRNDAFSYRVIETILGARHPYHDGRYWDSDEDVELAQAVLAELDVADLIYRDVRTLSGGERQRVAIAALLAQDAQLMLLDEPTNWLDLSHQMKTARLLMQCCKTKDKTIVMVSHDLNLVQSIATHVLLIMGDGSWRAGPVVDMMNPDALSLCLGYPITMTQHGERHVFLPADFIQ